jgi:CubicO group peptidase (beta-lactamase class C family)
MSTRTTSWLARFVPVLILASPIAAQQSDPLRGLDAYIEKSRTDWGVAGLAVSIVRHDSVIYAKGFGLRDVTKPDKVDERTLFAIGSNSKSFTATAVGMLQDEGKLNLNDKATKYLPWFAVSDAYITNELTLRDLMTHRSGYFRGDAVWMGSDFSRDEVLHRAVQLQRSTSFRSTFGYNNIMFLAAGEIVGKVSGTTWDAFVKQRIFGPLGMTTSNTSTKDLPAGGDVATPHALVNGKPVAIKYRNIDNVAPAGSINSNVLEMAQYVRFHLRDGSYQGKQLLSKKYHDEMLTPQMIAGTGRDSLMPMVHFDTYGLALWLRDYYGKKLVSHGGGIDGMLSQMAWVPEADVGVVVLTNTDGQNLMNALTYKILDQLLGAPDRDWSAIYLNQSHLAEKRSDSVRAALASHRVSGTKPSLPLEQYTGTYDNAFYGPLRIEQDAGGLVLRRSSVSWAKLEHWHFDTFRIEWNTSRTPGTGSFAMFQVDPNGRATVLEVRGPPFASPYAEGALFTRKAEERAATGSN